jgi:hypothetical protein
MRSQKGKTFWLNSARNNCILHARPFPAFQNPIRTATCKHLQIRAALFNPAFKVWDFIFRLWTLQNFSDQLNIRQTVEFFTSNREQAFDEIRQMYVGISGERAAFERNRAAAAEALTGAEQSMDARERNLSKRETELRERNSEPLTRRGSPWMSKGKILKVRKLERSVRKLGSGIWPDK